MATRKSTRVIVKAEDLTQKDDADKTTKSVQSSRNLKKRKTSNEKDTSIENQPTRGRPKGKRGNVKFAIDIPFDVLLEIFKLLQPIDLLHLSRVSKSLHASLTSDDMVSLWKSAYNNVPLRQQPPFCPDDTNIVFYTNFLYGRHCQHCSSVYGRIYHESAFIRLCSKCAKDSFLNLEDRSLDSSVCKLCNQWSIPNRKKFCTVRVILKDEYILRLKEFKAKYTKRYTKERESVVCKRSSLAHELDRWRNWMQDTRVRELKAILSQREADIKRKLEAEGFKPDSDGICYSWAYRVPYARKPHALTDLEWSFIRADILDFFQDIREEQALSDVKYELHRSLYNLKQFLLRWKIRPATWWIASSEPIASFIKSESKQKSTDDFKKVERNVCDIIASWQEKTDRYLATLIPRPPGGKEKKNIRTSTFELATTFFKCHWCTEPISYPRILMHACFFNEHKEETGNEGSDESDMEDFEEDMPIDPRTRARGPRQPRSPMEITPATVFPLISDQYTVGMCAGKMGVAFDEEASKVARDIIMVCGEDPNTITYAEMEESPKRLECVRCTRAMQEKPRAKSARLVMKWIMALIHELEEHYGEVPSLEPAWRKIDSEEDLDKVEKAENHVKTLKKYQQTFVSCNHCSLSADSLHEKLYHIKNHHEITADNATVLQHFSPPVDASIAMSYPAVKI